MPSLKHITPYNVEIILILCNVFVLTIIFYLFIFLAVENAIIVVVLPIYRIYYY